MTSLLSTASNRPEPVLDAAKLAAAVSGTVSAIGAAFVLVGWVTADDIKNWAVIAGGVVVSIGTLVSVAMPIITALGARAQVTPLAAPVSVEGHPLTAVGGPLSLAAPEPREIVDDLRDLERADDTGPLRRWPPTTPLQQVGAWTPATPASLAHEPTPIGAEAEAATTGRTSRISTPTA